MKSQNENYIKSIEKLSKFKCKQENFDKKICKWINSELLRDKIIINCRHKKMVIIPIWVESYYDQLIGKKYKCYALHGYPEQKTSDNQFRLYFHRNGEGGTDLVLSNDKLTLSILIKTCYYSFDGNPFKYVTQKKFSARKDGIFQEEIVKGKRLTCSISKPNPEIILKACIIDNKDKRFKNAKLRDIIRKGIVQKKGKEKKLASYNTGNNQILNCGDDVKKQYEKVNKHFSKIKLN